MEKLRTWQFASISKSDDKFQGIFSESKFSFSLLEENLQLFRAENKMNEDVWPEYIRYCDDIVHKNLLHTVGVSISKSEEKYQDIFN